MIAMSSQITGVSIICSAVCSDADQIKHQSPESLTFRGIYRWPVDSPHKGPVTRKMFPFDDVITSTEPLSSDRASIAEMSVEKSFALPLISSIFKITHTPYLPISHLYLADIITVKLWWQLSNMNVNHWVLLTFFYKLTWSLMETQTCRALAPTAAQLFLYKNDNAKCFFLWYAIVRAEAYVYLRGLSRYFDTIIVQQKGIVIHNPPLYDIAIYPYMTRLDKVLNILML